MSQQTAQNLQHALNLHRAGRLAEAETLYQQILREDPNNPDALQLLGFLLHQARRDPRAVALLKQAISINPATASYHNQLGLVLMEQAQPRAAIDTFHRALQLDPNFAAAQNNLGNVLQSQGEFESAIVAHRHAVRLHPTNAEFHFNLGTALKLRGQLQAAADSFQTAVKLQPRFAKAQNNLGYSLFLQGAFDEAIAHFREAIQLKSDYAEAYSNLGAALCKKSKGAEGISEIQTAIRLRPDYAEAYYNLSLALRAMNKPVESIAQLRRTIELKPDLAQAHWDLALSLLKEGQFEEGWREFEWRLKWKEFPAPRRQFKQPKWEGQTLSGQPVLVYGEQGLGDTVQFARYVPLVAERGGHVVLECQPELNRLMRRLPGVTQVISTGDALPHFDFHCPLLTIPHVTTPLTIPSGNGYLTPDPADVQTWKARLGNDDRRLKVGLAWGGSGKVWAGSAASAAEEKRSIGLARLAPLMRANCRFISLQKGAAAAETMSPPAGLNLIDYTQNLHDFADTAALMANLDLVISVDTSVAHVAGALGIPTWAMLPFDADWRWRAGGPQSLWYPTIKMFRQKSPGEWEDVIERIAAALGNAER